jgi:methyl halide transferase
MSLEKSYWSERWEHGQTGWDIGHASRFLIEAAKNFPKETKILIPGCGSGWEAEALFRNGFTQVHVVDIVDLPLLKFKQRVPDFPTEQLICGDFFALHGGYELILEQTFFCALDPSLRQKYAEKMHSLLVPNGVLTGLLFDFPLTSEGPPFGGSVEEYLGYFERLFTVEEMEKTELSIPPRAGRELGFRLRKNA